MAELALDYSEIDDAAKASKKVADYCEDYIEEIDKKIKNKLSRIEGGASSYTNQAVNYANMKIQQLNDKKDKFLQYEKRLNNFVNDGSGAKAVDVKAANTLRSSYNMYIKEHNIRVNPLVESLTALYVWGGDIPGFGNVLKQGYSLIEGAKEGWEDLVYWYRCEGGRNAIKIGLAIAGAAFAIAAIATVAIPALIGAMAALSGLAATAGALATATAVWNVVVAGAGVIGGVIGAIDACVNVYHEYHAWKNTKNGKAAEGIMSSNIDTASDAMRATLFKNKITNKISMITASIWDVTSIACDAIGLTDIGVNGVKFFKNGGVDKIKLDWKKHKTAKLKGNTVAKKNSILGKWDDFYNGWKDTTKAVNHVTENATLKDFTETFEKQHKWFKRMNSVTDKAKKVEKVVDYGQTFVDDGAKGVIKKGAKDLITDFDVVDKIWNPAEKTVKYVKKVSNGNHIPSGRNMASGGSYMGGR